MSDKKSKASLKKKIQQIKIVLTDVDGVLTDEGMYYTENGLAMKKFNVKDGMGSSLLRAAGFTLGLITSDVSPVNKARGERLLFEYVIVGTYAKLDAAKKICEEKSCTLENVAFIGDDVNDLEVLKAVGLAVAPRNAMPEIKKVADYICEKRGGEGAYRELAELLLAHKPKPKVEKATF